MYENKFLGKEISILANKMNRMIDRNVYKYGITCVQGKIIGYIYNESPKRDIFQKDIEQEFQIRRSSVTSVLKLLEKKKFIKRIPYNEDGRLKKIVLTQEGVEVHMAAFKAILEIENSITKVLTPEEIDIFFDAIKRLNKSIIG